MKLFSPTRYLRRTHFQLLLVVSFVFASGAARSATPVKIDLSLDSGRSDTATRGWFEWQVPNGQEASKNLAGLDVTLRAPSGELQGSWFKAGLATGATMATDGIVVASSSGSPVLEIEIRNLNSGPHALVTYHNGLSEKQLTDCTVQVVGGAAAGPVTPSLRAATNEEAESAYVEFTARAGEPVLVRLSAPGGDTVVLNGIEIDGSDPKHKARSPRPASGDWHVDADDGEVVLRWAAPESAVKYHVYVASDADSRRAADVISNATMESGGPHVGSVTENQWIMRVDPHRTLRHCCWRVDAVDDNGKVTRGDVWKFRPRHLAFPSAEGYGRFAIGGRGGQVIKVTNLDDHGPGSLRAALEAAGPRTVLFDVSGRIVLESRLIVRNPYLTLAGQTAPGKGICVSNYNLGMLGAHDCVLRFMRVRPGDTAGKTLDGMGMASCDYSIIDHCSISWTQDEAFSSRGAKDITLQRTLISEALNVAGHKKYAKGKQHGYAASIGGDVGSFHHNLLAHCAGRNWSLAGGIDKAGVHAGRLDIRNNVVYNWGHRTTDGGAKEVNFVNNYYRPGPASHVFHVLKPEHQLPFGPQEYYVIGNVMEGHYGADERYAGVAESPNKPMEEYIVQQPFFEPHVTTTSAEQAFDDVLGDVGCNRPHLDDHDRRVIEETRSGTTTYQGSVTGYPGLPDSQEDVGGWEDYPEVHRPADWDTDGDGLPNWWEQRTNLNPNSTPDDFTDTHADRDADGYTNLEEYLNWMATHTYGE